MTIPPIPVYPGLYAVGDLVSRPWPKSGHAAMVQAGVAVRHWHAGIRGLPLPEPYRPVVLEVFEIGGGRAILAFSDTFFGGGREILYQGRPAAWMKAGLQWAYGRTAGNLPLWPR